MYTAFVPEKLVIPILISNLDVRAQLLESLGKAFGPVDFTSPLLPFTYTQYYDQEMGTPLQRLFVSMEKLVDPSRLADIKQSTGQIENQFRVQGKRRVNLDPGLLSLSRFILASTKDSAHRIPLKQGIYAEITLQYERKEFRAISWTYPDYASVEYRRILKEIRTLYTKQLKNI
jgi:hypothetical protein